MTRTKSEGAIMTKSKKHPFAISQRLKRSKRGLFLTLPLICQIPLHLGCSTNQNNRNSEGRSPSKDHVILGNSNYDDSQVDSSRLEYVVWNLTNDINTRSIQVEQVGFCLKIASDPTESSKKSYPEDSCKWVDYFHITNHGPIKADGTSNLTSEYYSKRVVNPQNLQKNKERFWTNQLDTSMNQVDWQKRLESEWNSMEQFRKSNPPKLTNSKLNLMSIVSLVGLYHYLDLRQCRSAEPYWSQLVVLNPIRRGNLMISQTDILAMEKLKIGTDYFKTSMEIKPLSFEAVYIDTIDSKNSSYGPSISLNYDGPRKDIVDSQKPYFATTIRDYHWECHKLYNPQWPDIPVDDYMISLDKSNSERLVEKLDWHWKAYPKNDLKAEDIANTQIDELSFSALEGKLSATEEFIKNHRGDELYIKLHDNLIKQFTDCSKEENTKCEN